MNNNTLSEGRGIDKIEMSIHIDSELVEKIKHLTNDPSRVIESALKEWLKGEKPQDDDLTRSLRRNPPIPPKGEWND